jgi:hypothetical protein
LLFAESWLHDAATLPPYFSLNGKQSFPQNLLQKMIRGLSRVVFGLVHQYLLYKIGVIEHIKLAMEEPERKDGAHARAIVLKEIVWTLAKKQQVADYRPSTGCLRRSLSFR